MGTTLRWIWEQVFRGGWHLDAEPSDGVAKGVEKFQSLRDGEDSHQPAPTTWVGLPQPSVFREIFPVPGLTRIDASVSWPRVTTVSFGAGAAAHPPRHHDPTAPSVARNQVRRLPRPRPPAGVPLRDRLRCLLQPPLETILGDQRLYVPLEPFAYQYEGIGFLAGRWSAILADEMGLGKTMQSIMAIRLLLRTGSIESVLLVCPKPLVSNWLREFALWAEEIPVAALPADSAARRAFWIYDPSAVKIANYESLVRDAELVNSPSHSFDLVVLDEAQRIKNRDSKTAKVVHAIRRKRGWALTGTPVENRPEDLLSLLEFVHNRAKREEPLPRRGLDALRDAVGEVILRRTKDMVLDDLPQRMTRDVYVDLGPEQRRTYDSAEKDGVVRLDSMGSHITIEHVFRLIGQLKQICNFDPATGESAKADLLLSELEEVASCGKKAIVFSQYVTTLEELARRLAAFGPLLFHGGVAHRQREQVVHEFRENPGRRVLLLSYGAGAVGLNLQVSNYVFLFDRWWNPAVEDQAINRAHRIGQKDRVVVVRYLCPQTIESRIAQVLAHKRELFSSLIDGHDPGEAALGMSTDEIFGLFDLKVRPKAA